jgi:hypothetical protein
MGANQVQVPQALAQPENGAQTGSSEDRITEGTVQELANRALQSRDARDFQTWQDSANQLLMQEMRNQASVQGQGITG